MRAWIAGCLVLTSVVPHARAQDEEAQLAALRADFERAESEFERGLYASAAEHFEAVFEGLTALEHPRAALVLFNLGRSYEELGQNDRAIEYYERFLIDASRDAPGREEAQDRLAELRRRVAHAEGGDGSAPGGDDTGLWVGAGVSYGVGVVGFGMMAVAGVLALERYDEARAGCGATSSCTDEQVSDIRTLSSVSDIGLGVGLAGIAAGTVFLVLGLTSGGGDDESALRIVPALDPTHAGLSARGVF